METKPTYEVHDELTELVSKLSDMIGPNETKRLLYHLEKILDGSGWGSVSISFRRGSMYDIAHTETEIIGSK